MALRGELVNWEIERQKAKQMRDIELCGAISDAGEAFKCAESMGYGSGYYADQISVYRAEQKKRKGKSEFERMKESWLEMNRIYGQ